MANKPLAPIIGGATAGNAQATVTFAPPSSDGGAPITSYLATSTPDGFIGTGAASPITVTNLHNGTAYTFKVRATNEVGTGPESQASNSVTPATVPGAPLIGAAYAGNAQAMVSFTPPTTNGGSAIVSYTATSSPGGISRSGPASPLLVEGLANGTTYTFSVTATNAVGTGPPSSVSNAVAPSAEPTSGQAKLELIDTFATAAMSALIMAHATHSVAPPANHYLRVAQDAYLAAQAMLNARLAALEKFIPMAIPLGLPAPLPPQPEPP